MHILTPLNSEIFISFPSSVFFSFFQEGDTPLHCGVWHGYQGVVECLVRAGSSLHCTNRDGEMPLHVAAVRGYLSLVRFLCENRAGVNARDKVCASVFAPCLCVCLYVSEMSVVCLWVNVCSNVYVCVCLPGSKLETWEGCGEVFTKLTFLSSFCLCFSLKSC